MSTNSQKTLSDPIHSFIHHNYSIRQRHCLIFSGPGRTKQSFKDECDINRIMARYQSTGELPNLNNVEPQYLDCSEFDFQNHQNFIAGAFSMFNELPSGIRSRFENDPGKFLDFCSQEKNRPELAEMGLLRPNADPVISSATLNLSTGENGSNQAEEKSA